jgi:molecular chaperone GrpE
MEDTTAKAKNQEIPAGEKSESTHAKTPSEGSPKKTRKAIIDGLKKDIEEHKRLAQDNYEKFLRAYAELENYKKRVEKDRAENLKYANEGLLRHLLPFIDNLERAVDHALAEENDHSKALIEGVELTLKDLVKVLENYGLTPIESVGKPFDPSVHEAMMQVESEIQEPETVVEEFQKGYLIKDRLLRPARVSVAMKNKTGPVKNTTGGGDH